MLSAVGIPFCIQRQGRWRLCLTMSTHGLMRIEIVGEEGAGWGLKR